MIFGDKAVPSRIWNKLRVTEVRCWEWLGTKYNGYGKVGYEGNTSALIHRVMWKLANGNFPNKGRQLDHLCRNRACANPAHLEDVSPKENVRRGLGPSLSALRQLRKTHCPAGHEYSEENTNVYKGNRQCKTCHREGVKRRWRAKHAPRLLSK